MILDSVNFPSDLRKLPEGDLPQAVQDLRQVILETVSKIGGHLGASLGAADLAVALHYVFDTPRDILVWDTGHQGYGHKVLTGRRAALSSIRQSGGISGFLKRKESEYDSFGAGHASTAASAALGMAIARDLRGEGHKVVAIVGDGGLTGGIAYEALLHAGHLGTDLLVVLNDNRMFISYSVGAMGTFLTKLLSTALAEKFGKQLNKFLKRLDRWGVNLPRLAKRLRVIFFPGMLFEEMGFAYLGPVDGHNVIELVHVLQRVKHLKGPVLLHAVTVKGKGYEPAEKDQIKYHGLTPFDLATGKVHASATPAPPAYTKVFSQALVKMAKADKRIVAITAAMPEGTGLDLFRKEIPERFFDVGIAEQHAVTFAAGMACEGMRPVCAIYSTFLQRAYDQIIHDAAFQKLPVIFVLDRAGLVGEDGPTHHGIFDLSYLRFIPNMVIMSPKDENELQHMLATAIAYEKGPIALRYPRGSGSGAPLDAEFKILPIGKGEWIRRSEGRADAALLAIGSMVGVSLKVAAKLSQQGMSVSVANARYVKPLDLDLIRDAARTATLLVTLEENTGLGGFGAAVREAASEIHLPVRIQTIALPDGFQDHGAPKILHEQYGLSVDRIAEKIVSWVRPAKVVPEATTPLEKVS